MSRRLLDAVALLVALTGIWVGHLGLGAVPPLGPFLDPAGGVWAVARGSEPLGSGTYRLNGLEAPVDVRIDRRGVPHIFAQSSVDAAEVLGYLVARDRLFQMEIQVRAAAGRLTEWVGRRALAADQQSREIGLAWAAERKWAAFDTTSDSYRILQAYARGVNAWIDQLTPTSMPFEYRLLQATPARWEPKHTLYFYSEMGRTLAFTGEEFLRPRVSALVGPEAADALFPVHEPVQEPIEPSGRGGPYRLVEALPPPSDRPSTLTEIPENRLEVLAGIDPSSHDDPVGSNNWAVAPARTERGFALLAGDPHLQLTLPSIWYEVHLQVRDTFDVVGVSFPGSPGVVIGYNRDLAWSFTNTGGDVLDYYLERVDDPGAPTSYFLDGGWHPLTLRPTTYLDADGSVLQRDTLRYTHRGPLLEVEGAWYSMRWTVHDQSDDVGVFHRLQRSRSADEWLHTMESFVAPTQNGIVADRRGVIAIRASGAWPIRPGDGRGDRIFDGTRSSSDWTGVLPVARYPGAREPTQGFLVSANQEPRDPKADPAYLGANWPSPWRAMRINHLLRSDSAVTVDDMRRFQVDPGSARVDALLPFLLEPALASAADDREAVTEAQSILSAWDRSYRTDQRGPILFEMTVDRLEDLLWDELIPPGRSPARRVATPAETILWLLLDRPGSPWWDDRRTEGRTENRDVLLSRSLAEAYRETVAARGDPDEGGWDWGGIRFANISHLLRLPALSRLSIPVEGGPSTISPSAGRGGHGASWRMVVELGPTVTGWATYPGGQSGNPASRWYDDRIEQWQYGGLDSVLFPNTPDGLAGDDLLSAIGFVPGQQR